jgi:hypothetical protein
MVATSKSAGAQKKFIILLFKAGGIRMAEQTTYRSMENKIKRLESEIGDYVRKEKAFSHHQKLVEDGHMRRTISLMKIIEEMRIEIKALRHTDQDELRHVSHHLSERVKELNTLYDISTLRSGINYSLDHILQAVVDFIPAAIRFPENACARILFDHDEFATHNFKDTQWKLSKEIELNNDRIGVLEICYLEETLEIETMPFVTETENLIAAIAENISQIVEREWAEIEIRKGRAKIEALINENRI